MSLKLIEPHEIGNTQLLSSTVPEDDAPEWAAGTYDTDDEVIVIGDTHAIFKSAVDGNTTNPIEDDGTNWVNIGSTNRWKAFDQYIGDPATQADSLNWKLGFIDMTSGLALIGVDAAEVTVVMRDGDDAIVFDETVSLQDESGVIDAWTYFFTPIVRYGTFALTDLPPYRNATVEITASSTGDMVQVGQVVVGLSETLGDALNNMDLGIDDYSRVNTDDFGRRGIVERDYAETMDLSFAYPTVKANYLRSRIASRRAKPTVFTVDTRYRDNDFIVYGFATSMTPYVRYAEISEANIEVRSLV